MQTTYSLDHVAAVAGQVVSKHSVVGKYQGSEEIPAGRAVELHTDGKLRLYRGGKLVGISMYRDAKEPGAWAADDYVPVLRAGTIWCDVDGESDTIVDLNDARVHGADTTATKRGKLTDSAATSASDAQIYAVNGVKFYGAATADTGLALAEVDLNGKADAPTVSLLSHTANDYVVPATLKSGSVIELNTSAANSTVSLPTAYANGTVLYLMADGTKNGHTLTFRDVTTAISAATTASKRVAAVAIKAGGAWAITLTVGP